MLFQLICIDRRYQRLNCFNMRQLDTVLRRQFFTDFFSTGDHKQLMNETLLGLRFKLNQGEGAQFDSFTFFNYGTTLNTGTKHTPLYVAQLYDISDFLSTSLVTLYKGLVSGDTTTVARFYTGFTFSDFITSFVSSVQYFTSTLLLPVSLVNTELLAHVAPTLSLNQGLFVNTNQTTGVYSFGDLTSTDETSFSLEAESSMGGVDNLNALFADSGTSGRFTRFTNPMVEYEYRKGTYFTV